jgi:hypothetical protein
MSSVLSLWWAGASAVPAVPAVASTVPTVQEVQERAREEQQPRENPEDVGGVLGHDEEPGDDQEGEQHQTRTRSEPRACLWGLFRWHLIPPA